MDPIGRQLLEGGSGASLQLKIRERSWPAWKKSQLKVVCYSVLKAGLPRATPDADMAAAAPMGILLVWVD